MLNVHLLVSQNKITGYKGIDFFAKEKQAWFWDYLCSYILQLIDWQSRHDLAA